VYQPDRGGYSPAPERRSSHFGQAEGSSEEQRICDATSQMPCFGASSSSGRTGRRVAANLLFGTNLLLDLTSRTVQRGVDEPYGRITRPLMD
jgi:hypothetical protein